MTRPLQRLFENAFTFPFLFGYMGYVMLRGDPEHHDRLTAAAGGAFLFGIAVCLTVSGHLAPKDLA